jgi:hypothetical protein
MKKEKIIVERFNENFQSNVNRYLEEGWSVKMIHSSCGADSLTKILIAVLEKDV